MRYPPLRIHVWGGLGSQLFAASLAHTLKSRFPNRSLVLVLHSSGVTRREPEILKLFPNFQFEMVDDFTERVNHDSHSKIPSLQSLFRGLVRRILLVSGILAEENTSEGYRAHRWTFALRGHYFHRNVSPEFLQLLEMRLSKCVAEDLIAFQDEITLHYRLGDLLELENKSFVDPQRIGSLLSHVKQSDKVAVFSDSPDVAVTLIEQTAKNKILHSANYPTVETIYAASRGAVFVGTSSKISYWVVLLRLADSGYSSYLPKEDLSTISILSNAASRVNFY